ncbi:MAG TPA: C2H2-type zinc finger protein [Nitrososphaera sp.]|jgi:DNA-directed RNA polymerase subunit RPC12/RpoP|nr:C2H2-type zinc finger protein [Nitrososphaera sp.]
MAETNIFKCDVCGREFELGYQLEMHVEYIHESSSLHKCTQCGQEFGMKEQLEMHLAKYAHDANDKSRNDYRGYRPAEPSRKLY